MQSHIKELFPKENILWIGKSIVHKTIDPLNKVYIQWRILFALFPITFSLLILLNASLIIHPYVLILTYFIGFVILFGISIFEYKKTERINHIFKESMTYVITDRHVLLFEDRNLLQTEKIENINNINIETWSIKKASIYFGKENEYYDAWSLLYYNGKLENFIKDVTIKCFPPFLDISNAEEVYQLLSDLLPHPDTS